MSIIAILALLKPFLGPLFALLAGWLLPSPLQKAARSQEEIDAAERLAQSSRGNVSDLDNLP